MSDYVVLPSEEAYHDYCRTVAEQIRHGQPRLRRLGTWALRFMPERRKLAVDAVDEELYEQAYVKSKLAVPNDEHTQAIADQLVRPHLGINSAGWPNNPTLIAAEALVLGRARELEQALTFGDSEALADEVYGLQYEATHGGVGNEALLQAVNDALERQLAKVVGSMIIDAKSIALVAAVDALQKCPHILIPALKIDDSWRSSAAVLATVEGCLGTSANHDVMEHWDVLEQLGIVTSSSRLPESFEPKIEPTFQALLKLASGSERREYINQLDNYIYLVRRGDGGIGNDWHERYAEQIAGVLVSAAFMVRDNNLALYQAVLRRHELLPSDDEVCSDTLAQLSVKELANHRVTSWLAARDLLVVCKRLQILGVTTEVLSRVEESMEVRGNLLRQIHNQRTNTPTEIEANLGTLDELEAFFA